ncbi:hypothetical protein PanWU01x14_252810, partial [Parasponia andersonii]
MLWLMIGHRTIAGSSAKDDALALSSSGGRHAPEAVRRKGGNDDLFQKEGESELKVSAWLRGTHLMGMGA